MQIADFRRPVLSALAVGAALCLAPAAAFAKAGSPNFSALSSPQLSTAAVGSVGANSLANFFVTFDVSGIFSNDEEGSLINEVYLLDIGASGSVVGLGWDVKISSYPPSWLSEMDVSLGASMAPPSVILTVGIGDDFSGKSVSYSSGGIVDLVPLGLNFMVGNDGLLRLEFSEWFADYPGTWDGVWDSGSLTFEVTPIPEPSTYGLMALGLLGVAAAARRRKA